MLFGPRRNVILAAPRCYFRDMPAKISIMNNGSIRVEGEFTVCDAEGKPFGLGDATKSVCAAAAIPKTSRFVTAPIAK